MTTTQNLKEKKKHMKIEVTAPRQRINPPQNTNQNKSAVTSFSNGKKSVEKMDQEEIMQENKTTNEDLRQMAERALHQKPLLYWENNELKINANEHGFKPDPEKLDQMIQLSHEQINSLSKETLSKCAFSC